MIRMTLNLILAYSPSYSSCSPLPQSILPLPIINNLTTHNETDRQTDRQTEMRKKDEKGWRRRRRQEGLKRGRRRKLNDTHCNAHT